MASLASAVLVIIAHPDDETIFAGLIHALTHKLHATVDLVCVTNGEGGFRHSAPSESFYGNLQLSNETIARQHLPRIRKAELLGSGQILGIRKFFFYDQFDLKYSRDVETVFTEQWDKEWVIQQLERTIKTGNSVRGYDLMLIMLPSVQSHGHHTASGLLALEAVERLRKDPSKNVTIPTVVGGSEFPLTERPTYPLNQLAEISTSEPWEFRFDRKWKLSNSSDIPDYQMILLWASAEHKSQGGLMSEILSGLSRQYEQYFYFSINNQDDMATARIQLIRNLFDRLTNIHQHDSGNVL